MANPSTAEWEYLYWIFFWVTAALSVLVYGWLIWAGVKYRARPGQKPPKGALKAGVYPYPRGDHRVEVGWTLASFVVVAIITAFSINSLVKITEEPTEPGVSIQVIAQQWLWTLISENGTLCETTHGRNAQDEMTPSTRCWDSAKRELCRTETDAGCKVELPCGVPIKFLVTAKDVIHALFIPELRIKTDAFPNRVNVVTATITEAGDYRMPCTEYCGIDHGLMIGSLHVSGPCG